MQILQEEGKLTFLRVHDKGTGYGPQNDFIDAEVVFRLSSSPEKAFGFQLRNDEFGPSREGMLALLRDAFINNFTVTTDYMFEQGKTTAIAIRVWLHK